MDKKEQLLEVRPSNELKFRGPFHVNVMTRMQLTNPTDKFVLFKIKTTAPKKYCVRPNCGNVDPKGTVNITITLQAHSFDPSEKNKHKFMVQSLIAPEGEYNIDELWREASDQLMDTKLRCVFEVPTENPTAPTEPSPTTTAVTTSQNDAECELPASHAEEIVDQDPNNLAPSAIFQLRKSEGQLRQENLQLKEQLLCLRMAVEAYNIEKTAPTSTTATTTAAYPNSYSPPQQNSMIYIAAAVAMAIFGYIIGKFLL